MLGSFFNVACQQIGLYPVLPSGSAYAPITHSEQCSAISSPAGLNYAALSECVRVQVPAKRCPSGSLTAGIQIHHHYFRTCCWAKGQRGICGVHHQGSNPCNETEQLIVVLPVVVLRNRGRWVQTHT